jgi:hypothetical protein
MVADAPSLRHDNLLNTFVVKLFEDNGELYCAIFFMGVEPQRLRPPWTAPVSSAQSATTAQGAKAARRSAGVSCCAQTSYKAKHE